MQKSQPPLPPHLTARAGAVQGHKLAHRLGDTERGAALGRDEMPELAVKVLGVGLGARGGLGLRAK